MDAEQVPWEETWYGRILAKIPSGVDATLVDESLRLTPTERIERMLGMLRFVEEIEANRGAQLRSSDRGAPPGTS